MPVHHTGRSLVLQIAWEELHIVSPRTCVRPRPFSAAMICQPA